MTGDRVAHPLLISLANIDADIRMKASNHAFLLLALLPVVDLNVPSSHQSAMKNRLFHHCVNICTEPLQSVARLGHMMADPVGNVRCCYTPLAAYICDNPEALLVSVTTTNASPLTMATHKHFGDQFRHTPRTAATTITSLNTLASQHNPYDLQAYLKAAKAYHLNGVHLPFWTGWALADPSLFLTPEPLHQWHKEFYDHDRKWCVNAVGADEINFRFQIIHPRTNARRFKKGISNLKNCTGHEHRAMQCSIVGVIAGAVSGDFMRCIRSLMDFRYIAQIPVISEDDLAQGLATLKEFHNYKQAILDIGARRGKKNNLDHFHIPKLELMQSVMPNTRLSGAPFQWTADVTEHEHIVKVKIPVRGTNGRDESAQICRTLDRNDKMRRFDLATALRQAGLKGDQVLVSDVLRNVCARNLPYDYSDNIVPTSGVPIGVVAGVAAMDAGADNSENGSDDDDDSNNVNGEKYTGIGDDLTHSDVPVVHDPNVLGEGVINSHLAPKRAQCDYFAKARIVQAASKKQHPPRIFVSGQTALHLNVAPSLPKKSIDDVARMFNIPDLRAALADYYLHIAKGSMPVPAIGGRRVSAPDAELPYANVRVWYKVKIQTRSPHDGSILPPNSIHTLPLHSKDWTLGRNDAALIHSNTKTRGKLVPYNGLKGMLLDCHHHTYMLITFITQDSSLRKFVLYFSQSGTQRDLYQLEHRSLFMRNASTSFPSSHRVCTKLQKPWCQRLPLVCTFCAGLFAQTTSLALAVLSH